MARGSTGHWALVERVGSHSDGAVVVADGCTNMAIDTALLASIRAGGAPTLRLYRWTSPTLSFGRNQPAAGLYAEALARERGIAFVRRPTGGQAVLHDDELTYAVAAPVELIGRPRAAYRRINAALVAGLRELGLDARVADGASGTSSGTTRATGHDWAAACFRRPAPGEVVVSGLKLVGSAQRYERGVILQHGSILVGGSQAAAEALLLDGGRSRQATGAEAGEAGDVDSGVGWTTVTGALGRRPSWEELVAAVIAGWEEILGTGLARRGLSVEERARAEELRDRYASPEWTWRR